MISKYEIKVEKEEEVLYLYLDYGYEMAQELGNVEKNLSIIDKVKQYIHKMKIKFKGKYIVLVIAGIATVTLACSSSSLTENNDFIYVPDILEISHYKMFPDNIIEKKEEVVEKENIEEVITKENIEKNQLVESNKKTETQLPNSNKPTSNQSIQKPSTNQNTPSKPNNTQDNASQQKPNTSTENKEMVIIYRSNGMIETIALEEYLIGVIGAEMPASFHSEALKAQAVVARTYALKRIQEGKVLTDTTSTQVYKDNNQLKTMWGNSYTNYYNKIKNAVDSTKGLIITYQNKPIDAVFHSTSNGYTVDAKDVWGNDIPYLKSVSSPFDKIASSYLKETSKEIQDITKQLGITINENSKIEIVQKDKNGRVIQVSIDGKIYSGLEMRNKLGLRSTDFDILFDGMTITFTTRGYGHGVGMSQYGANGMANNGSNYKEIILHYYTNVNIEKKA